MKEPKDKAKELIVQFYGHTTTAQKAINCAIIAVEHIRDQVYRSADVHAMEYWNKVREELDKRKGEVND